MSRRCASFALTPALHCPALCYPFLPAFPPAPSGITTKQLGLGWAALLSPPLPSLLVLLPGRLLNMEWGLRTAANLHTFNVLDTGPMLGRAHRAMGRVLVWTSAKEAAHVICNVGNREGGVPVSRQNSFSMPAPPCACPCLPCPQRRGDAAAGPLQTAHTWAPPLLAAAELTAAVVEPLAPLLLLRVLLQPSPHSAPCRLWEVGYLGLAPALVCAAPHTPAAAPPRWRARRAACRCAQRRQGGQQKNQNIAGG